MTPLRLGDGLTKSPRSAVRFDDICRLQTDNFDSGPYWIMVDEVDVTICHRKHDYDRIGMLTIPREHFSRLADWYNKEQQPDEPKS